MPADMLLFKKGEIGGQEVENRVVLAPMTRARCDPTPDDVFNIKNQLANDVMGLYYEQRADHNLLITEGTQISEASSGWLNAPWVSGPEHAKAWKPVVDRVHAKGSIFYCQLWHLGRAAHSSYHPSTGKTFAPSAIKINGSQAKSIHGAYSEPEVPAAMTIEEIEETVKEFVQAARTAKEAGFDGVELHGANGYLIDSFLQSSTNHRTDQYGGSVQNRARFLHEIIDAIIADGAYPAARIGFRISPNGTYNGMGSDDNDTAFPEIVKSLNGKGLAYVHVMDGLGYGFHNLCPVVTCAAIRKVWDGIILANVGLTRDTGEGMLRSGAIDFAVYGRDYISNPDLIERFKNDLPLTPAPGYEHYWHATGARGYTDWPTYAEEQKAKEATEGEATSTA